MKLPLGAAVERGRFYAFPAVWAAVLVTGVGLRQPLPPIDVTSFLAFNADQRLALPRPDFGAMDADTTALTFVRHDGPEADEASHAGSRDVWGAHGRFGAPGNAVRRQVQLRPINPRTADDASSVKVHPGIGKLSGAGLPGPNRFKMARKVATRRTDNSCTAWRITSARSSGTTNWYCTNPRAP